MVPRDNSGYLPVRQGADSGIRHGYTGTADAGVAMADGYMAMEEKS